jgi:hypothetical protein
VGRGADPGPGARGGAPPPPPRGSHPQSGALGAGGGASPPPGAPQPELREHPPRPRRGGGRAGQDRGVRGRQAPRRRHSGPAVGLQRLRQHRAHRAGHA